MNGYEEDELYEDDDFDDYEDEGNGRYYGEGRSETSYSCTLLKATNGHLAVHEGWLTRYPGEDWGEASGWQERTLRLGEVDPEIKERAIELGRSLQPGEDTPFFYWYEEEREETE